jgi:hypothetical protein
MDWNQHFHFETMVLLLAGAKGCRSLSMQERPFFMVQLILAAE